MISEEIPIATIQPDVSLPAKRWQIMAIWISSHLEANQRDTIPVLDGVRALACLSVIEYHLALMTHDTHLWSYQSLPLASAVVLSGNAGVMLFFVLSGFLLFLPYARSILLDLPWPDARQFYLRRALRIIPGYYTALLFLVTLQHPEYLQPQHWQQLSLFLLFFMDSTSTTFQQINGPFWTLAIEWQFYLLLPLIALGIRFLAHRSKSAHRPFWLLIGLVFLAIWGLAARGIGQYCQLHPTALFGVPRPVLEGILFFIYGYEGKYLEDFAIGMLVSGCFVFCLAPSGSGLKRWLDRLSSWIWWCGVCLLVAMAMSIFSITNDYVWPILNSLFVALSSFGAFGFSIGFGMCMLALLFDHSWLGRCFTWTPLRWLGLMSYSLYLWHQPLLLAFSHNIGVHLNSIPHVLGYTLYWLWVFAFIVPFSLVAYLRVEMPGIWLIGWLRRHNQLNQKM